MNVLELELMKAWAAGVFDSEGCALIRKISESNPSYQILVSVSSMSPEVTMPIKEIWGGKFPRDQDAYIRLGLSRRQTWCLYFSRVEAKRFLVDIFPYLKFKRDDVLIVLEALQIIPDEDEIHDRGLIRAPSGTSRVLIPLYHKLSELRESRIPSQAL